MGYPTLAGALDELFSAGFIEHFGVSGAVLRSFDSGRTFTALEVVIREYHRFEGVSDPDDTSIVYAIEGQDGACGTLVDAFGAYADAAVGAFLQGVPIRRAGQSGEGLGGLPWMVGPPGEMFERNPARALPRFGRYRHGYPVPVPRDPWNDEGGESGPNL